MATKEQAFGVLGSSSTIFNSITPSSYPTGRIALIGAACRFPGAENLQALSDVLFAGQEAIGAIPLLRPSIATAEIERAGLIDAPELFDPQFFGIAQREANHMDPQQRLVMELVVEALESAGIPRTSLSGSKTGVYIGIATYDYSRLQMQRQESGDLYSGTGNAFSIAANRVSYFLNLAGPSMAVDTACSSSLTAVHLAVQALRSGEIDFAIVGGVNLLLSHELMQVFAGANMLAPDGRCKTFDEKADGYVRGEGCGVVILRRAEDAATVGDRQLAHIAGSAINQDGRTNGLTAPSGPAQAAVIRAALADAGLQPSDIDAIELHGTGTPLGDPIEAQALGDVFAAHRQHPLMVGSIKTNIGHLEAAAGIAGLIKATVALHAGRLPPSLNFQHANPNIELDVLRLAVATSEQPLAADGRPARIGISSFGFGGTNAHVVLESAPQSDKPSVPAATDQAWLLPLSAASAEALTAQAAQIHAYLVKADPAVLPDIVYTASIRRDHMDHRLAVFGTLPVLIDALAAAAVGGTHPFLLRGNRPATGPRRLALVGYTAKCEMQIRQWGVNVAAVLTSQDGIAEQLNGRWDVLQAGDITATELPDRLRSFTKVSALEDGLLATGAMLYVLGHALDWNAVSLSGQVVDLPAYPWQRRRCWFTEDAIALQTRPREVLALAADDRETLFAQAAAVLTQLDHVTPPALADLCWHTNLQARQGKLRVAIPASTRDELRQGLLQVQIDVPVVTSHIEQGVVFIVTGQGSVAPGAGAELYRDVPVFRVAINRCSALLDGLLDVPLTTLLFDSTQSASLMRQTRYAQPAQFALAWSLAQLWTAWGVRPAALIGHSLGEYVAAVLADMAPLEQVLPMVARRGALMQETSHNAGMLVVKAAAETVAPLLEGTSNFALAADNGHSSCVVAGDADAVNILAEQLAAQGIRNRLLDVSAAFHSPLMEPILDRLFALTHAIDWHAPKLPLISNLTGYFFDKAPDAQYWVNHARNTVRYREGIDTLLSSGHRVFVELGPQASLVNLGATQNNGTDAIWLSSLDGPGYDWMSICDSLACLYQQGADVDWAAFSSPPQHSTSTSHNNKNTDLRQEVSMLPASTTPASQPVEMFEAHLQTVRTDVVNQIAKALGESASNLPTERPFIEMGADSVMMAEAMRSIQATYGVKISARQLLNDLNTIDALSQHLAKHTVPATAAKEALPQANNALPTMAALPNGVPTEYAGLFQQQLQLVQQVINSQLAMLGAAPVASVAQSLPASQPTGLSAKATAVPVSAARTSTTVKQQAHLEAFTEAYVARTATSKRMADERRLCLADVRASAGFRPSLKEMVYPISGERAKGAYLWDVDGNQYVDLSMDFGVNLFGHGAQILTDAIKRQADLGLALGTRSPLAADVSQMLCEMTGMDRVLFCQSGSESVMTALRLARLLRERSKIAVFRKSYHGHFDGVLGDRAAAGEWAEPVTPGILPNFVSDLLVLDYDSDAALASIAAHADELAAVLVEPVQSRALDVQPREFLQRLRELTARHGILLIFDEMITGFRTAPGGAQQVFGVEADLVTYGKTLGGGVPMAALAARGRLLDGIDGGIWRFGDHSAPDANTTFFAGTFNNHPLGFALSHAVLSELKRRGPGFQEDLNGRTEMLTERLNARFATDGVPLSMTRFGSVFRFKHTGNLDLLYYHLLHRGLFVWEGRNCFLCDAHGEAEINAIVDGVMESVAALRDGDYLPAKAVSTPSRFATCPQSNTLPMSDTQRQICLAALLDPAGANAYCETVALEIDGDINAAMIERALTQLSLRHEALRTTLDAETGTQTVLPTLKIPLRYAERTEVDTWLRQFATEPFAFTDAGPLQVGLLKLAENRHVLALRAHHALIDGWSLALIVEELGALCCPTSGAVLPAALPFRRQLDGLLATQDIAAEAFWCERTADAPTPLVLTPSSSISVTTQSSRWEGERLRLPVPPELAEALTSLAVRQKTTLFTAALGVTLSFLHSLCDQDDVLIGVPTHGRFDGLERMVGQAAQIMPLRSRLQRGVQFQGLLDWLGDELEAMSNYQAYPLARILEPVLAGGDDRPGALTVTFNLDRIRKPTFDGMPTKLLDAPVVAVKIDLAINLLQSDAGWLLDLDYQSQRHSREDIVQFGRRWMDWAARMAAMPDSVLDNSNALTAPELIQLLHGFNGPKQDLDTLLPMPAQVAQIAARYPDRIAVTADGKRIDYRTLDLAARAVAGNLLELGAGPDRIVAVMLPRSLELVTTVLGIFYAGAAYMPLDPNEPIQRREEIFAESKPVALVTTGEVLARVTAPCPILIAEPPEVMAAMPEAKTEPAQIGFEQLAFVIYTSGSTNKPKGVQCSHGSLANLLAWSQQRFGLDENDAVLLKAPYTFDISVWEMSLPLAAGARLVVVAPEGHRDPIYLVGLINLERVTVVQFVPAMLEAFIAEPESATCRSLRYVFAGGEALHTSLCEAFFKLGLPAELHNLYGPTETCILVTHCQCLPDDTGPVPIGYPITNTYMRIVDGQGRPVGVGMEGELLIGGNALARGYLNRPEQSAKSFIDDPFVNGARLYRSGDRARWRPDGAVEYLGRVDGQVKLRGLRIEVGAIEHVLRHHPAVQEAVVDLRGKEAVHQRLVAWLVYRTGEQPVSNDVLQDWVKAYLPVYMMPTQFVTVATLPISRHGKVDRGALIEPEFLVDAAKAQAPRTAVETELLAYAHNTLKIAIAGVDENFFSAGGQSLAAAQLITWVQQHWSVRLALRAFFENPTLSQLGVLIESALANDAAPAADSGLTSRSRRRVKREALSGDMLSEVEGGAE
ncbi:hybrid non-ribosomal peptide synthetase/type I polyketide synthase [Chitinimonas sp. PSY-7]|uniref:amino acid adenylation domain-containing protein n=1 Tax=Chitinimonas sp. PSY-7 TaxID=3459088 RepID=UPI004040276D